MSEAQTLSHPDTSLVTHPVINNFTITFGTINGSGSQTANVTLMRAIFKMGIPVSGKNIFPSNIQGQPTWYTIRVNKDGFLARREDNDLVVAMNPASFKRDLDSLLPGGAFFYPDDIKLPIDRTDIVAYPMPVKKISREADIPNNLRDYIGNMVYVGVLAQLLDIDLKKIYEALDFHFNGKQKAIDSNYSVIMHAYDWSAANLVKRDPYRVEAMNETAGLIISDGNTASGLGAIYGGVQFVAWYPITPASSLAESMNEYLPRLRVDPQTGKNTYAVVQAEDELAAIGMAVGAGWAGLRSMTSTSGPGLSLMSEYAGLAYYAEIPVVIWDVQRVGPSTGLPTRTAQDDLTLIYFMSHGDTQHVMLFPATVSECFELGWKAFDLAERLQTPVFVLTDLDLGMNVWMSEPFKYPDLPMDRGKVLWEEDLKRIAEPWGRYLDVDGDGIPYRTIPGNKLPGSGYLTRGTGHDEYARYSEEAVVWERVMNRLKKKFNQAKTILPPPVIENSLHARIGIMAYGSTDLAVKEARHLLAEKGIATDALRIRSIPFADEVKEFITAHDRVYVVEINRDGQMKQLLSINYPDLAGRLVSLAHMDGLPLTARWIEHALMACEEK